MAVKTRDELLGYLNTLTGESTDDSTLEMIQDFTDTLDNYETNAQVDWQQKFQENDAQWRKKYRDRFFGNSDDDDEKDKPDPMHPPVDPRKPKKEETLMIDDLFTKVTK